LDDEGTETRPIEHNLVRRDGSSDCVACQGFRQGQVRSQSQKRRRPLRPVDTNRGDDNRGDATKIRKATRYWCSTCKVALCNNDYCWYIYHS
jgi:hypothetical protein